MASFLDKAGLTKFWEFVKQHINNNFVLSSQHTIDFNSLNMGIKDIYTNLYIDVPKDTILRYFDSYKSYRPDNLSTDTGITILLKFINKSLLLQNINRINPVSISKTINLILGGLSIVYLGRLPYNEVYNNVFNNPVYGDISFDIYLKAVYDRGFHSVKLALVPISLSNSYTINSITGERMIRYLEGDIKNLSSYKYYKVDLVTDSPFNTKQLSPVTGLNNRIDKNSLIHLYNRHDIEYTIRYPRYLNGILTFLKIDSNDNITLADKTPDVVDGTYNEVTLTQDTGLYMYGNIFTRFFERNISENMGFNISTTSPDTTDKLLSLEGDISTIYNLLKLREFFQNTGYEETLLLIKTFKLFHSPYIGYININNFNNSVPFDPINRILPLYFRLFNNTGISTAISGIHLIGYKPYISTRYDTGNYEGIYNNYEEAYKNCKQLTKLMVYVYLEGDLDLDSTLRDYHINNTWTSIKNMIDGSSKLNNIVLLPGVQGGLTQTDFEKFSRLIKPIADKIKSEQSSWNVEIKNLNIP